LKPDDAEPGSPLTPLLEQVEEILRRSPALQETVEIETLGHLWTQVESLLLTLPAPTHRNEDLARASALAEKVTQLLVTTRESQMRQALERESSNQGEMTYRRGLPPSPGPGRLDIQG